MRLSEKASNLAESNGPNQQSSSTEKRHLCLVSRSALYRGILDGCCELAVRAVSPKTDASLCRLGPPHSLVRSPAPIHISLQFFTLAPGYRPSLIRGADRPCPHPDPSSLEHVNLPVTHTGTHTHTHICSRHTHLTRGGGSNHVNLRNRSH